MKAEDALDAFLRDPVDLVFLDIFLAGDMDGLEFARSIPREIMPDIFFVSASDDRQTQERIADIPHRGYISKPYSFAEIENLLNEAP
jgi:DNA-binding response OmpR family regulator